MENISDLLSERLIKILILSGSGLILIRLFYNDLLNYVNILTFLPFFGLQAALYIGFFIVCLIWSIRYCVKPGSIKKFIPIVLWLIFCAVTLTIEPVNTDFTRNQKTLHQIATQIEANLQEGEFIFHSKYDTKLRGFKIISDPQKDEVLPRSLAQLKLPDTQIIRSISAGKYQGRTVISLSRYCWSIMFSCLDGKYTYVSNGQLKAYSLKQNCPSEKMNCRGLQYVDFNGPARKLNNQWYWSETYDD
jgi:hypothetical protein